MPYKLLEDKRDLSLYLDRLIEAVKAMLEKTGRYGQTPQSVIGLMTTFIPGNGFLLIHETGDTFDGFLFAILIPDEPAWIDVIALWARPGQGKVHRFEAYELMMSWARSHKATRAITNITRSPDVFFENFYKPLGFNKIGYILEAPIK